MTTGTLPSKRQANARAFVIGCASLIAGALVWEYVARRYFTPVRLPPLSQIFERAVETTADGRLPQHIAASMFRILAGFVIGSAVGIALGLAMGAFATVRRFLDPIVNFLRWAVTDGQKLTTALDYAPLPKPVQERVLKTIDTLTVQGTKVSAK